MYTLPKISLPSLTHLTGRYEWLGYYHKGNYNILYSLTVHRKNLNTTFPIIVLTTDMP